MAPRMVIQIAMMALTFFGHTLAGPVIARAATATDCPHPTTFMAQKIDHSPGKNATFQQKYQIIDDYYKPGGFIFYSHGDEGPLGCLEGGILPVWAKEIGAVVVASEHRFFGQSLPNNSSDLAIKYQSMTSENVFGDSLTLIDMVRGRYPDAGKAVIFGGSYPGFMSAVLRLNHPEVFYASFAWATATRCFGEPSTDPFRYNHYAWLSDLYTDLSVTAAAKIKAALQTLADGLKENKIPPLVSSIGLCTPPQDSTDLQTMLTQMVEQMSYISQYSLTSPALFKVNALPTLINTTEQASTDTEVLSALVKTITSNNGKSCWDYHLTGFEGVAELEPYYALMCSYYPLDQTYNIPDGTIFPPIAGRAWNDTALGMGVCPKLGFPLEKVPTYKQISEKLHFTKAEIEASTRILFPKGEYDPISGACGPAPFNGVGTTGYLDPTSSRVMFVAEGAHGEDADVPSPNSKVSVVHAQQVELQILKEWLGVQ